MHKLIKFIVLNTIIIAFPISLIGQNWQPVHLYEKYNYQRGNTEIIYETIWADSIQASMQDTVYFLNKICKKTYYCTIWRNAFTFLQREFICKEDKYVFSDPNTYVLLKNIDIGDNWMFDTLQSITATLDTTLHTLTFGTEDSIRIISLWDGISNYIDTLLWSKNYGIIRFPNFNDSSKFYSLIGLETAELGIQNPGVREIYDFSVGDLFETLTNNWWDYGGLNWGSILTYRKYKITFADSSDNYLIYHKKGLWKRMDENWNVTYGLINSTDTISLTSSSWLNKYNHQFAEDNYNYGKLIKYSISPDFGRFIKSLDGDYYNLDDPGDTIFCANMMEITENSYAVGLGETQFKYVDWDEYYNTYAWEKELVAFEKDNQFYGTFTSWSALMSPAIKNEMKIPVADTAISQEDTLVVALPDDFDEYQWSTGSDSSAIIIAGADYEVGTYTFSVDITYYFYSQSDQIEVSILYPDPQVSFSWILEENHCLFSGEAVNPDHIISWVWDFGDGYTSGEQNPQHSYDENGAYTVCLSVTNEDQSVYEYCDTVHLSLSIDGERVAEPIQVRVQKPDLIVENTGFTYIDVQLQLFDQEGRNVKNTHLAALPPGDQTHLNLSDLPGGIYILRILTGNKIHTRKIFL